MDIKIENLGKCLRLQRTYEKKSLKEVADAIGITYQSYQAYERGLSLPTLENFLKLCAYFDLTPNELLDIS